MTKLKTLLRTYERDLLAAAIKRHFGNVSALARELDIDRTVLHKRMKNLGVTIVRIEKSKAMPTSAAPTHVPSASTKLSALSLASLSPPPIFDFSSFGDWN